MDVGWKHVRKKIIRDFRINDALYQRFVFERKVNDFGIQIRKTSYFSLAHPDILKYSRVQVFCKQHIS